MDTAPDCTGTGVKPIIHKNYDGGDIQLPDDPAQIIRVKEHPYLASRKGDDIITASGTTLLGADDKAGVAVIMDMVHFLTQNPELEHGHIKILSAHPTKRLVMVWIRRNPEPGKRRFWLYPRCRGTRYPRG